MKLRDLFEEYRDHTFKRVVLSGNHGDYINRKGLNKLVSEIGLRLIENVGKDTVIYMHGGGAFIHYWGHSPRVMRELREKNPDNVLIVGPSTVTKDESYLRRTLPPDSSKIFFGCREKTTYEIMKQFYTNVYLDECPSFNLNRDDFNVELMNKHSLLIERKDREGVPLPEEINRDDYDIVVAGAFEYGDWLNLHAHAHTITVNHLHNSILSYLLGKKNVTLFRNSYHKNRSIWEHSLEQRGVKWIGPPC